MKMFFISICLLFTLQSQAFEVSKYGKFLANNSSELEVVFVPIKASEDVLIKISGALAEKAGIDGKVIRHTPEATGLATSYKYKNKTGKWSYRLRAQKSWGHSHFEVYFGNKTHHVYEVKNKSKNIKTLHIKTEFLKKKK